MLTLVLSIAAAFSPETCDHGVSLSNGKSDDHVTGTVTCKREGRVTRTMVYRNGKREGLTTFFAEDGTKRLEEEYVDDRLHGERRQFDDGVLVEIQRYDGGSAARQRSTRLYADGSIRSEEWAGEDGTSRWDFTPDGELGSLSCGGPSLGKRHTAWCTGARPVQTRWDEGGVKATYTLADGAFHGDYAFHNRDGVVEREGRYSHGERVGLWVYRRADGTLEVKQQRADDGEVRQEEHFHPDGDTLAARKEWDDEGPKLVHTFYMNGQPKEKRSRTPKGVRIVHFHDTGEKAEAGLYGDDGRCYREPLCGGRPMGTHRVFDEKGRLVAETDYEDGRVAARRTYDAKSGKLQEEEAYYPDGSRKKR